MEDYLHITSKKVPLYGGLIVIVLTNSNKKLGKYVYMKPKEEHFAFCVPGNYRNQGAFYCVLNFNNKDGKISHGVIAHEAVHLANFILKDAGVRCDYNNDEPLTYLVQWITNRIYSFINKKGFKIILK